MVQCDIKNRKINEKYFVQKIFIEFIMFHFHIVYFFVFVYFRDWVYAAISIVKLGNSKPWFFVTYSKIVCSVRFTIDIIKVVNSSWSYTKLNNGIIKMSVNCQGCFFPQNKKAHRIDSHNFALNVVWIWIHWKVFFFIIDPFHCISGNKKEI